MTAVSPPPTTTLPDLPIVGNAKTLKPVPGFAFVDEVMNESRKLENQLRTLRTERSVAVLHYSPITDTIEGEPPAIFQYLGSQRLCEPIDRFDHVKAVVHGHAHHGTYEGRTPRGIPVYNVAQFVLKPKFGKPYVVIEV